MTTNEQNIRLIFGLKVKQLRQQLGLSFADLADISGLSVSYLNEIEKGKKYPKTEKIIALSKALGTSYDELVSLRLSKQLAPIAWLLNSDILSQLPLEVFGLEAGTLLDMIANAPAKVNAFINTIIKIARNYELTNEHFYFAALRSYQEMNDNYFEDLEEAADAFVRTHNVDVTPPMERQPLYEILEREYGYAIDRETLRIYPELARFRSVYLPKERKLLINDQLSNTQKSFLLGKEIAYNYLKIKERPHTTNVARVGSFEEALNNFKASYFSVALLMNRALIRDDLEAFFARTTWEPEVLRAMLEKYQASPEMFLHRVASMLPRFFGVNNIFFLRINHSLDTGKIQITKELHFSRLHSPHRNDLDEHYCRRWVSLRVLHTLTGQLKQAKSTGVVIDAQRSHYTNTKEEYFCLSLAIPNTPTPNTNVSVTLGISVDAAVKRKIRFLDDSAIPVRTVGETCERCAIADCRERVAEPVVANKLAAQRQVNERLLELMK